LIDQAFFLLDTHTETHTVTDATVHPTNGSAAINVSNNPFNGP